MSSVAPNVTTSSPLDRAHALEMSKPLPSRTFHVIATNPEGWQSRYLDIPATCPDEAKALARRELRKTKNDDWSIDMVVEAVA